MGCLSVECWKQDEMHTEPLHSYTIPVESIPDYLQVWFRFDHIRYTHFLVFGHNLLMRHVGFGKKSNICCIKRHVKGAIWRGNFWGKGHKKKLAISRRFKGCAALYWQAGLLGAICVSYNVITFWKCQYPDKSEMLFYFMQSNLTWGKGGGYMNKAQLRDWRFASGLTTPLSHDFLHGKNGRSLIA